MSTLSMPKMVKGKMVSVQGQPTDVTFVITSQPFKNWEKRFDANRLDLLEIMVHHMVLDPHDEKQIRSATISVRVRDCETKAIETQIFTLGHDAVCVLIVLTCDETGEQFVLLVQQTRLAAGSGCFQEVVAGTDNAGDRPRVRMLHEILEETTLDFEERAIHPLGVWSPSPGTSSEFVLGFWASKRVSRIELEDLRDRISGKVSEDERTIVQLMTIPDFVAAAGNNDVFDGKLLSLIGLIVLRMCPNVMEEALGLIK